MRLTIFGGGFRVQLAHTAGSRAAAAPAHAAHPLVDSVPAAVRLLDRNVEEHPELAYPHRP